MKIIIESELPFSELRQDKAYGLAKKMIMNPTTNKCKRVGDFVLTGRLSTKLVHIKIRSSDIELIKE